MQLCPALQTLCRYIIPLHSLKCLENISKSTMFARNYGTAAVISYNLKGIAPPVPPVQCWTDKNLMSGFEAPTLH